MGSRQTHWHRSEEPMVIYSARRLALLVGFGCASVESNKAVLRVDQLREQRGVRAGLVILPLLAHSSCRELRPRRRPKLELQLHSSLALAPEPGSRRQPAKADQLTPRTKRSRATDSEPTGWP